MGWKKIRRRNKEQTKTERERSAVYKMWKIYLITAVVPMGHHSPHFDTSFTAESRILSCSET
jgi:hypothetical protein